MVVPTTVPPDVVMASVDRLFVPVKVSVPMPPPSAPAVAIVYDPCPGPVSAI